MDVVKEQIAKLKYWATVFPECNKKWWRDIKYKIKVKNHVKQTWTFNHPYNWSY